MEDMRLQSLQAESRPEENVQGNGVKVIGVTTGPGKTAAGSGEPGEGYAPGVCRMVSCSTPSGSVTGRRDGRFKGDS